MMKAIKVLLLEDRKDDAELVVRELKYGGFDPDWRRVETEVDFKNHLDPSLDVILADYSLPQFNAIHALQAVQERGLDVPFIIVSGSIGEELAVAAVRTGAFDYVIKDRLTRLPQTVSMAISQRKLLAEKRDSEKEQLKLQSQLRQAHKMEAIGQLAGGVAHDFNNILQVILGNASILQGGALEQNGPSPELEGILNAVARAADLTRRLLAFGRRQVFQSRDLELNALVEGLLKMVTRLIGTSIQLDFIQGHSLGIVHVDPGQIDQALMNLIINARDSLPDGGKITIETENVTINGEYLRTHPWVKMGRYVLLSISDTGCGMSKETQDRIFEPFFTTKTPDKGTGLGLAMVHGIVNQHNGFIHVYSEPGQGSTFKIYLPIVERRATTVGTKIEGPIVGGVETILIAEDEDAVRELAFRILSRAGYECHLAVDGVDAVEKFNEIKDCVDLVLLDAIMPRMNGRVAFDRIRAIRPDVRVLFSSGYSVNVIPDALLTGKDVDLIQKPYDPDGLLRKTREMLDLRTESKQPESPSGADGV
jgi:signal transduction histidine kinase